MINTIKTICVYSSASNFLDETYYKTARELGELMAKSGFNLIYGGGTLGTMGVNAKAVKESGGKVYGVLPEKLHEVGVGNNECDELIITKGMRERKEKLDSLADAAIAIAGGFGTLEELAEMIVQKQLGYNDKAIVILNTNGFYDDLIKFFEKIITQNFANPDARDLYFVANTPQDAIQYFQNYKPKHYNVYEKLHLEEKSGAID